MATYKSVCAVATTPPSSPSTFYSFSGLPAELRLQIWHLAIPDGVYVHFSRHPFQENVSQHLIARCSSNRVPSMLHTNSEARVVALEYFEILGVGASRAYFNPAVDTLMLGKVFQPSDEFIAWYPHKILGPNARRVRHVVFCAAMFYSSTLQEGVLKQFQQLESFAVLDLTEWDVALGSDFDAPRAEKLVKLEGEELKGIEDGMPELRRLVLRVKDVWRRMRERKRSWM